MKPLYLPVSQSTIDELFGADEPGDWIASAPKLDVISVLVLMQVPVWLDKDDGDIAWKWAGPFFRDLDEGTRDTASIGALRAFAKKSFDQEALKRAVDESDDSMVWLTPESVLDAVKPSFIDAMGGLRAGFSDAVAGKLSGTSFETRDRNLFKMRLTDPQGRAMQKIVNEPNESMVIDGYAGTGKSDLIKWIASANTGFNKLILALTYNQLTSLMRKVSSPRVKGKTFGQLARDLINAVSVSPEFNSRSQLSYNVTDTAIANHFGWTDAGQLRRVTIVQIVRGAITRFCSSTDQYLSENHLPVLADKLSMTDRKALVAYAERFWSELFDPAPGNAFLPVRGYHMIKYAALRGLTVSAEFDQVIVEEAHDLSGPMAQILDRANLSVIKLGDKFQRFEGFVPGKHEGVRGQQLDVSMRAGKAIENVINPIIESHPFSQTELPLKAGAEIETRCDFYDRPVLPDSPCTLLVGSNWHMLQWFQLLQSENARFALLPASKDRFERFVYGIIELYHEGKRAQTPELFRYPNWEALQKQMHSMKAFGRVERLLKRGFSANDFANGLKKTVSPEKAPYLLGLADDSRNMEFDNVMLTPEMLSQVTNRQGLQTAISRVYVGSSRARNKLILPGYLVDWLSDSKRVKNKDD